MPDDFQQQKSQMKEQMQESMQTDDASENLEEAAQSMHRTAMTQMQQNQEISQAFVQTQQQIQSLSNSVRQLTTQLQMERQNQGMASAPAPAPRPQPSMNMGGPAEEVASSGGFGQAVGNVGAAAGSAMATAGGMAASGAQVAAQRTKSAVQNVRRETQHATVMNPGTGAPGVVKAGDYGATSSTMHAMAPTWNPESAKQYTAGAYQKAFSRQSGVRGQDVAGGVRSMGLAALTPSSALAGGAATAFPYVGGALAPKIKEWTSPLDKAAPTSYMNEQVSRARFFGEQAQNQSSSFLRGRTEDTDAAGQLGQFGIEEQGEIGRSLRRMNVKDLTMSGQDIGEFQRMFSGGGTLEGVQTSEEYARHMKEQVQSAKRIMKNFQVGKKEAVKFMEGMYNQMGANPGRQMMQMQSRAFTATHLSGQSMGQTIQGGMQGAQMAANNNLMPQLGGQIGFETQALGGISSTQMARSGQSELVSAVGGEQGLSQMGQRTSQQYLQGAGGTMLGLGGSYTDISKGLQQAAGGIQGAGDIMDFAANRHERISSAAEGLGPQGTQLQKMGQVMDLANKFDVPGSKMEDRMNLVAQQQFGMSSQKAEAFVEQAKSMPETLRRQARSQSKQASNNIEDLVKERQSPRGLAKRAYRYVMEGAAGNAIRGASRLEHKIGAGIRETTQDISDSFYGIERDFTARGTHESIVNASSEEMKEILPEAEERSGLTDPSVTKYKNIRERTDSETLDTVEELKRRVEETSLPSKKRRLIKAGTDALGSDKRYDSVDEMVSEFEGGLGPPGELSPRERNAATSAMKIEGDALPGDEGKGGQTFSEAVESARESKGESVEEKMGGGKGLGFFGGGGGGLMAGMSRGGVDLENAAPKHQARMNMAQEVFGMTSDEGTEKIKEITGSPEVREAIQKAKKGARKAANNRDADAKDRAEQVEGIMEDMNPKSRDKVITALKRSGIWNAQEEKIEFGSMYEEGASVLGIGDPSRSQKNAIEKFMTGKISRDKLSKKIGQDVSKTQGEDIREGVFSADQDEMEMLGEIEQRETAIKSARNTLGGMASRSGGVMQHAVGIEEHIKQDAIEPKAVGETVLSAFQEASEKEIEKARKPIKDIMRQAEQKGWNKEQIGYKVISEGAKINTPVGERVSRSEGAGEEVLDSELAGTESVKEMLSSMRAQNAALREVKKNLKKLNK